MLSQKMKFKPGGEMKAYQERAKRRIADLAGYIADRMRGGR